jgi:alpha-beta hydrolase superfamily lysophospholipase
MPCGCGTRSVNAGWYFPNQDQPPAGVVYLQHGFLDNSANLSALAVHVAQTTNSIVVTPDISSNFFASDGWWLNSTETAQSVADLFTGNREELTASASQAAGHDVSLPQQFVLAGHSAGGGLAVKAASDLVSGGASRGLAGVLMYDGVDFTSQMPQALAKLDGTNIPVLGQQLYTGLPLPANIAAVQTLSSTWINDMYTGTPIEGPPGQFTVIGQAPAAALPDVLSGVASILPNLITPVLPAVIGSLQPAAL